VAGSGRRDVLILGAGIAGCALAHHLAKAGLSAAVLDPRPTAGGATGRAAGILTEQLWNDWDIAVTREAHAEARTMLADARPEAYWQNGFLRWSSKAALGDPLRQAVKGLRSAGVDVEPVGSRELRELYPEGRFGEEAVGLYSPGDACVTPSTLAEAYARSARDLGVVFEDGRPVGSPRWEGDCWVVPSGSTSWSAPVLAVAAGAWSKRLFAELHRPLPLCPYRTQAALLRPNATRSTGFPSMHDIDTDVYVRPELDGRILGGNGTESVEADPERFVPGGDPGFLAHLAESLSGSFPSWAESEVVSAWAGVCTATPDRRPLVGPVPGAPGLFVMTGFNGFGVMRSGGVARRLAAVIREGGATARSLEGLSPVLPGRFRGPPTPFPPRAGFTLEAGDAPRF
jgi:glycine/D-amino acid oxidase-like deaminating enzyme